MILALNDSVEVMIGGKIVKGNLTNIKVYGIGNVESLDLFNLFLDRRSTTLDLEDNNHWAYLDQLLSINGKNLH